MAEELRRRPRNPLHVTATRAGFAVTGRRRIGAEWDPSPPAAPPAGAPSAHRSGGAAPRSLRASAPKLQKANGGAPSFVRWRVRETRSQSAQARGWNGSLARG